jgi:hypothetical protein
MQPSITTAPKQLMPPFLSFPVPMVASANAIAQNPTFVFAPPSLNRSANIIATTCRKLPKIRAAFIYYSKAPTILLSTA